MRYLSIRSTLKGGITKDFGLRVQIFAKNR